jgi:hypothetical protein
MKIHAHNARNRWQTMPVLVAIAAKPVVRFTRPERRNVT